MVLKLYGVSQSTATRRVGIVLKEKQVQFKLVPVDVAKREHKTPGHLTIHPFGQIPYIDDDGFILYESRAICRYIAEKYASQGTPELIPTDPKKRALFEQAASVEQAEFEHFANPAIFEKASKPYYGLEPDVKKFEESESELAKKLDIYDKILSSQKYLAGDFLTLADLFHLPHGTVLEQVGSKVIEERPNVTRWFKELQNRPSWQAVLKDGFET